MREYDTKTITCKSIAERVTKGKFSFDCDGFQRNLVWDDGRKDLFVCSLIENYPILPPFIEQKEKGSDFYDVIEGQQRINCIASFINGEYQLSEKCQNIKVLNEEEEEEEIEVWGNFFADLPEKIQTDILGRTLSFYVFDGLTKDKRKEMFHRVNNGKSLTAVELRRVKAISLSQFQEIASHDMIRLIGKNKFNQENIVMQSWTLCYYNEPDFSSKVYNEIIENATVTEEEKETLIKAVDTVHNFYMTLHPDIKEEKSIITKITRKSHIVSCIYLAKLCNDKDFSQERFNKIVYDFFNTGKKEASVSDNYNVSVGSSTAKKETLARRMKAIAELAE